MAMNQNEGGSAYPPNPDVKSGSCLIAGFHALTDIRPSYWNAYKAESGATFSIDMVRLRLSFINGKGGRTARLGERAVDVPALSVILPIARKLVAV